MSIYTRTGDTGTTSLFGGKRVLKCDELVDVYGSIDELNSWMGKIISQLKDKTFLSFLESIQRDLFVIGSTLAGFKGNTEDIKKRIPEMEACIDTIEKKIQPIRNFILPGGTGLASDIHITRSIARRVERQTVALQKNQKSTSMILNEVIMYLNRLSDFLFMFARLVNVEAGKNETVWKKI